MAELLIQYSTSTAFASACIRRLTHSPFSHVDIVLPGEGLLGVSGPGKYPGYNDPGGVQVRPFEPWPYLFQPKVAHIKCSEEVARRTIEFAKAQMNKPFDNSALWAFLKDRAGLKVASRDWRDPDKWFCSELVIRSAEVGGLFFYKLAITENEVSPNDTLLLFNPYMTIDSVHDFTGLANIPTLTPTESKQPLQPK
ncbi:MAG TPA: hypothetical protein VHA37_01920 [Candidatus Saccharimonadales bacterium]|nr:hypothetical protein [Candidatus Saccharimonadales bacterium]